MNTTLLLASLFKMLWWLLPLMVMAALIQTPGFKGWLGELLVRLAIKLSLDPEVYRAVHNVTLRTPDGSTQIDHVLISPFGIFSIKTKNYSGWIFGGEHQKTWTQKIFRKTYKFQNPLHQNYKHTQALQALLSAPSQAIHSVIVFVGGSTFKTEMPLNVRTASDFIAYIKSRNVPVFSPSEVEVLHNRLTGGRLAPTLATTREHVRNVRRRQDPMADRKCPRCGSPMLLRTQKSGSHAGRKFWGCSQFPKCRAVQNVA